MEYVVIAIIVVVIAYKIFSGGFSSFAPPDNADEIKAKGQIISDIQLSFSTVMRLSLQFFFANLIIAASVAFLWFIIHKIMS